MAAPCPRSQIPGSLSDAALCDLFDRIDTNRSGFLDLDELEESCSHLFLRPLRTARLQRTDSSSARLQQQRPPASSSSQVPSTSNAVASSTSAAAQDFMARADRDGDGRVSRAEFVAAIRAQEQELWGVYSSLSSSGGGVELRERLGPFFSDPRQCDLFAMMVLRQRAAHGGRQCTFAEFQAWVGLWRLQTLENSLDAFRTLDTGHEMSSVDTAPPAPPRAGKSGSDGGGGWAHSLQIGLAGMLAGVVSRTATAPMERLKIMLATGQLGATRSAGGGAGAGTGAGSAGAGAGGAGGAAAAAAAGGASRGGGGVLAQLRALVAAEGVIGLWRGNTANVLKVAPAKAMKFASFEWCLKACAHDPARPTGAESLAVSCGVAALATLVTHPLDTVKTMVASGAEPPRIAPLLGRLWREQGLRGLTAGLLPSLASGVPFIGVSMATFTTGKRMYNEARNLEPLRKPPVPVMLGLGVVATIAAEAVSYPMYAVKTNSQAALIEGRAQGALETARGIVASRGLLGLYCGVSVAALKSMPAAMISYTVYETVKAA